MQQPSVAQQKSRRKIASKKFRIHIVKHELDYLNAFTHNKHTPFLACRQEIFTEEEMLHGALSVKSK
jgi:hypothetical protein